MTWANLLQLQPSLGQSHALPGILSFAALRIACRRCWSELSRFPCSMLPQLLLLEQFGCLHFELLVGCAAARLEAFTTASAPSYNTFLIFVNEELSLTNSVIFSFQSESYKLQHHVIDYVYSLSSSTEPERR